MKLRNAFSKFAVGLIAVYFLFAAFTLSAQDAPPAEEQQHGISIANMDRSVKPGDDFYRVCQRRLDQAHAKFLRTAGASAFLRKLADLSNKRTAGLIEEIAKSNAPAGSGERKVADLYNSYMDEAGIEAKGLAPLRPHLDAIAAIHDKTRTGPRPRRNPARGRRCAQQHQLSHAKSVRTLGRARLQRFRALHRIFIAGRTCSFRIANITWPTMSTMQQHSHASTRRTSRPCSSWPDFRDADARATRRCRTRTRHREKHHHAGRKRRHPQSQQHVERS